jgi:hypothetical protein
MQILTLQYGIFTFIFYFAGMLMVLKSIFLCILFSKHSIYIYIDTYIHERIFIHINVCTQPYSYI